MKGANVRTIGTNRAKDDGLAAVPLIEVLGARDVFLFEKQRVAPREDPRPCLPAQKVSRGVSDQRGRHQRRIDQYNIQPPGA
jgi:hypothetical protein